jgi:hypothetical protein
VADLLRLGEQLVQQRIISAQQLQTALKIQERDGGRLGSILVSLGYISQQEIEANLPDMR